MHYFDGIKRELCFQYYTLLQLKELLVAVLLAQRAGHETKFQTFQMRNISFYPPTFHCSIFFSKLVFCCTKTDSKLLRSPIFT